MQGGYRVPFDPRPLLTSLRMDPASEELWKELIGELYHQGDVGDASYAATIELSQLWPSEMLLPWQAIALVVWVDLARTAGGNPPVPPNLQSDYNAAIDALARRCLLALLEETTPFQTSSMLGLVALWKGQRVYAKALVENSEEELAPLLPG